MLLIPALAIEDHKQMLMKGDILNFNSSEKTIGRRNPSRPQIRRILGGEGIIIDKVDCVYINQNKWNCAADVPESYVWNKINIDCEGAPYRNSPHIVRGSCQFQYNIVKKWSISQKIGYGILILIVSYYSPWWVSFLCAIILAFGNGPGRKYKGGRRRRLYGTATGSRS
jgi:hypothetical protein